MNESLAPRQGRDESRLARALITSIALRRHRSIPVDFDLTPFKALEKGVSRVHARITRDNELTHVIDLSSTNGTYLNGFRLIANQARILRSGDELILGRLKVVVKF